MARRNLARITQHHFTSPLFIGVLEPTHTLRWDLVVWIPSQPYVQWHHSDNLHYMAVGIFTPRKPTNTINHGFLFDWPTLLNIYQQTTLLENTFVFHLPGSNVYTCFGKTGDEDEAWFWCVHASPHYGLNCILPRFICQSPNSQYFRMWLPLERGPWKTWLC